MANCYICLHYEVCCDAADQGFSCLKVGLGACKHFKDKFDVEDVVRCKDCKYWTTDNDGCCTNLSALVSVKNENSNFCSYGERKAE